MFKIIILGSGSCIPSSTRGYPGTLIEIDGKKILVDAGSGTLNRMADLEMDHADINTIFLTHLHPDHSVDLISFLLALNYTPGYKRETKLEIYGPEGLNVFIQGLYKVYPSIIPKGYPLVTRELADSSFDVAGVEVASKKVEHADIPSLAFRFKDGQDTLVISGDTGYCEGILNISENADLLILESSFPTAELSNTSHLTAGEAGKIASAANAKTMVVKHLYPVCDEYDMKTLIEKEFKGEIIISEDAMGLQLSKGATTVLS